LEPVAHDGVVATYRGLRRPTGGPVSVRVWPVTLGDERARRRFLREARQAGELPHHPGRARVVDAGLTRDDRPFVVTEPLPPVTLADALRVEGPMPVDGAGRLGAEIADALASTHAAGLVHGRIDPSAVFLGPGRVLLADLGTEALTDALVRAAGPGRPRYFAAPEQLERGAVGAGTDVYSLAAVVHAALTGRAPHQQDGPGGATPAALLLLRALQDGPPRLDRPDVPEPLAEALRRALDPDPATRTASARDLAAALRVPVAVPPVAVAAPDPRDHWPEALPSTGPPADAPTSPVWAPMPASGGVRDGATDVDRAPARVDVHPIEPPARPPPAVPASRPPTGLPPAPPPPVPPGDRRGDRAPQRSPAKRLVPIALAAGALAVAVAVVVLTRPGGDDPTDPDPSGPAGPDVAAPSGLGAVERPEGVRLDWVGDAAERYAVLVLSEATAPVVLTAEDGSGFLVPAAELRPEVGYCFAVAPMAAVEDGASTEEAFTAPVCIRGASGDTVRRG
jgi:serine/threonine protein kinase